MTRKCVNCEDYNQLVLASGTVRDFCLLFDEIFELKESDCPEWCPKARVESCFDDKGQLKMDEFITMEEYKKSINEDD